MSRHHKFANAESDTEPDNRTDTRADTSTDTESNTKPDSGANGYTNTCTHASVPLREWSASERHIMRRA